MPCFEGSVLRGLFSKSIPFFRVFFALFLPAGWVLGCALFENPAVKGVLKG